MLFRAVAEPAKFARRRTRPHGSAVLLYELPQSNSSPHSLLIERYIKTTCSPFVALLLDNDPHFEDSGRGGCGTR